MVRTLNGERDILLRSSAITFCLTMAPPSLRHSSVAALLPARHLYSDHQRLRELRILHMHAVRSQI